MGLDDIDALPAVNIRGPVLAARAAIPLLGEGRRIISIGSTLAERVPFGGTTVYSLTKSALLAFTRGLARDLGARQITVNLLQSGSTDNDMNPADGEQAEGPRQLTALGRYGAPSEAAAAVAFRQARRRG